MVEQMASTVRLQERGLSGKLLHRITISTISFAYLLILGSR